MANMLHREIKEGEAIVLKGHPDKRFIVESGYGMHTYTSGCALYGHWDGYEGNFGPIDALWAIDIERTNAL